MPVVTPPSLRRIVSVVVLALAAPVVAQTTPPAPAAPAATTPPSPVSAIRNKLSAGDLPSAESVLEVHLQRNGADGPWLSGLGWLARGALLVGDTAAARRHASDARAACAERLAKGAKLEDDHDLESALGAAIEVQAQLEQRRHGARRAAASVRAELAAIPGPTSLRSRLHKRLDLLELPGTPAPPLEVEESLGPASPASWRGTPTVMFVFAEWCGDCKAQAAAIAKVKARYGERVRWVALTRHYETGADARGRETARVDSVWKAVYADVGAMPIVLSTASMVRYGGSSTPTFVFVDRNGIVRHYTPTRLTEGALEAEVAALVR